MSGQIGRPRWKAALVFLVLASAPAQQGCDGSFEDARARVRASSILVSPATLASWVTHGYGTDAFGYREMVVLDVSSASEYASEHVPGAFHLDTATDLMVSRSDGLGGTYRYTDGTTVWTDINAPAEVVPSDVMNAVIRRTGIGRSTVVVLAGNSLLNVGAAYFNFRYWGFPKERLRVLDRTKAAYKLAGQSLTAVMPPAPAPSAYGVCELAQNTSLRASLADMIRLAEGAVPGGVAWDVRNPGEYAGVAGSTAGPFAGKPGYTGKVAFEGHVLGAVNVPYTDHLGDADATLTNTVFLDAATIEASLAAVGITRAVTTHVY